MLVYRHPGESVGRPRDLAITDFRFAEHPDGVLAGRNGHSYLVYACGPRARAPFNGAPRQAVAADKRANAARRLAECMLYALGGGGALAAIWFGFVAPSAPAPPATAAFTAPSNVPMRSMMTVSAVRALR
jgi:hypothetical protein